MGKQATFIPKLDPDFELKRLGTVYGLPIYVDMAQEKFDEEKFQRFLIVQKLMADFFNPPSEPETEDLNV